MTAARRREGTVARKSDGPLLLGLFLPLLMVAGCPAGPSPTAVPPPPPTATPGPALFSAQGLACQQAGDGECARVAFSRTVELDPGFTPAYRARAAVHLALGEGAAALRDAQMAVAPAPGDAGAHALLGEILRRAFHDPLQALVAYNAAVWLDPSLSAARSDRIAELAAESARLHPKDPMRMYYRGRALLAQGLHRLAIRVLGETIEREGGLAAVWFVLGEAYAARRPGRRPSSATNRRRR